MKKPPFLLARILSAILLIYVWFAVFLPPKYFGLPDDHQSLGAINAGIFTLVWLWVFSIATGLNFGFEKLNFDFSIYKKTSGKKDKAP